MSKPILRLLLLSVFTFLPASMAQVGFSKCACTPGSYEFTLDFTATCKNSNIPNGDNAGIESTTCFTSPGSDRSITNFVFDKVLEILITEFSRGFSFLNNLQLRGPFLDGYTFTYTSITSDPNLTLESLPGILGIRIIGVNDEGQQFDTTWSVTFTNDCNSFPVFGDGGTVPQIGPTKLTSLGGEVAQYCPNPPLTLPPTTSPTEQPTSTPTQAPTRTPTMAPTKEPTAFPTSTPTLTPTLMPTVSPTTAPSVSPTNTPTVTPTQVPTRAPTMMPTKEPSLSPTSKPTMAPTPTPTMTPTLAPTGSPTLDDGDGDNGDGGSFVALIALLFRLFSRLFGT